jgi:transposase-like protein
MSVCSSREKREEQKKVTTHIHTHTPSCPSCGSLSLFKDGLRYLAGGESVQRFLCRSCGFRFSDPYELYDKLGLEKPKTVTQVTQVTDKTCGSKQLDGFLENELHAGSVTSVTSVTKEQREVLG